MRTRNRDSRRAGRSLRPFTSRRVELYAEYEAQCQREGVVDFAELLLRSYELLQRNEPLCQHYQARFRHILVDEFQDTNRLQYAWLKLLAGRGSVRRRARRASSRSATTTSRSTLSAAPRSATCATCSANSSSQNVIRLEQNYRSHGNILDAANALIKQNRGRLGKNLWTEAGAGEPIRVFEAYSDVDEARFIVEEIARTRATAFAPSDRPALSLQRAVAGARAPAVHGRACRTACMAACASSIGRRSSMRLPTCA
jgi:DNA helicase-2/ATP-dependent DNA helicase PcrA